MFILKSKDDPVVGPLSVNNDIVLENPNILIGETEYGGHLGYFEHLSNRNQFHCKPILSFMNAFRDDDNVNLRQNITDGSNDQII